MISLKQLCLFLSRIRFLFWYTFSFSNIKSLDANLHFRRNIICCLSFKKSGYYVRVSFSHSFNKTGELYLNLEINVSLFPFTFFFFHFLFSDSWLFILYFQPLIKSDWWKYIIKFVCRLYSQSRIIKFHLFVWYPFL